MSKNPYMVRIAHPEDCVAVHGAGNQQEVRDISLPVNPNIRHEITCMMFKTPGEEWNVGYHQHGNGLEFFLPTSGKIEIIAQGQITYMVPGDIFIILPFMSHGFRTNGRKVGWKNDVVGRERAYAAKNWVELPSIILDTAERLRGVQIECAPAAELIERFNSPDVLVYCDPPYVLSTRGGKQYRCEMTDNDHLQLLDVLKRHDGPVLISGYESLMYDSELRGWHKEKTTTTDQLSRVRKETLWMNFEPAAQCSIWDMSQPGG